MTLTFVQVFIFLVVFAQLLDDIASTCILDVIALLLYNMREWRFVVNLYFDFTYLYAELHSVASQL